MRIAMLCCLLLFSGVVLAADIVVSPDGADSNDGSAAAPVATLGRARALARAARAAGQTPVVLLRGGVHVLHEALELTELDAPATWKAWPGEQPIISGGQRLPAWTVRSDGLWSATCAGFADAPRLLRVGTARATRARHPNNGFFQGLTSKNFSTITFPADQLGPWTADPAVEFVSILEWTYHRHRIGASRVDLDKRSIAFPEPVLPLVYKPWASYLHPIIPKSPYYFEHARAFLDAPGEWWWDKDTQQVLYMPLAGDSATMSGVVARVPTLLRIAGSATAPVRDLRVIGLSFSDAAWEPPSNGFKPGQAGYFGGGLATQLSAAIHATGMVGGGFRACTLTHADGNGLALDRDCAQVAIERCHFREIAGNAIDIGDRITPRDPAQPFGVRDCRVSDCVIDTCAWIHPGCVGIWVGMVKNTVIERCAISNLPYSGISLGWQWSPGDKYLRLPTFAANNRISNCHIHHVMLLMSDGGGIYTLGLQPGTIISGNAIHDIPHRYGWANSNAIFLDEGSSEIRVEKNSCWNITESCLRFHKAAQVEITGNRFFGKKDMSFVSCKASDMIIGPNERSAGPPADPAALISGTGPQATP